MTKHEFISQKQTDNSFINSTLFVWVLAKKELKVHIAWENPGQSHHNKTFNNFKENLWQS